MKEIVMKYVRPYYPRMGVGFLIKFTGTIMDLCIPYVLAYIIDTVIPREEKHSVLFWGFVMLLCSLLALITVYVSGKSIPMYGILQEATDRFVRLVREDIAGIRVIKALSKTDYETEKFRDINREVVERERKNGMVMAVIDPSMNILLNLGLVCVIIVGAFRVNSGSSEVGKILAFTTYFTIILNAMMSISKMFAMISKAIASGNRIWQVLQSEEDMTILEEAYEETQTEGQDEAEIVFEQVNFSYFKKKEANIKDLSFRIAKGETLGIIGEIGSGKSTVINLMMRMYDADSGRILIGGRDVRSYRPEELKAKFGVVFQNDTIFEDTIAGNVTLGREMDACQIQEALLYARASEFVEEKSGREAEALNIRGANLSGGQKQRVLIARALAARPDILILDDSSSALDYKTDAALRKGIKEHFQDTTLVLVAQRVSSIRSADHILVMENGDAIGYGTHEELMESCSVYREISKSQMGEEEPGCPKEVRAVE